MNLIGVPHATVCTACGSSECERYEDKFGPYDWCHACGRVIEMLED